MSSGIRSTTTLTGLRALPSTKELSRQNTDPGAASQPFAAERDGFVEGARVLILESLEHAEERHAEILAEIVVYETSGDAILMQPGENGDGAYKLIVTEPKDTDLSSDTASKSSAGGAWDVAARLPIFYGAERKLTTRRIAVGASVLILALLAGVSYRQDIKVAQTRRALVAAVARFASRHSVVKPEPAAPIATSEPALVKKGPAQVTSTPTVQDLRSSREQLANGTTFVIVQPHDNLRRICLRYVGWYGARLVSQISELNPELTDPNHVIVGQRIVLPEPGTVGTTAPGPSAVPRP
jgi:hypothetical protein